MELEIKPLSTVLGAEVTGIDLSVRPDNATSQALADAYAKFGVLVFRDQKLDEHDLIDFTKVFGVLHIYPFADYAHPQHSEILILSNILGEDSKPIGLSDGGATWHTDNSYVKEPPRGTVLYAIEIPHDDLGNPLGDTLFSSTAAAYDDLPQELKRRLDGRSTTHSYEGKQNLRIKQGKYKRKPMTAETLKQVPPVEHPVFRTHAETGRKCVYVVSGECDGISGIPHDEANQILGELAERCTRPEYIYRHRWQDGDVVMWDNCLVQHLAVQNYALPQRRLLWRTTIKGGVPI